VVAGAPALLINGDDCVFRGHQSLERYWKELCSYFGFTPSPGKCYFSKYFFQINSQSYFPDWEGRFPLYTVRASPEDNPILDGRVVFSGYARPEDVTRVVREVPYVGVPFVNMGLLENKSRSTTVSGSEKKVSEQVLSPTGSLGSRCTALVEMAPRDLSDTLVTEFMFRNRKILKQVSKYQIPFFLPTWFGGLGLPVSESHGPSDLDLRIAAYMVYSGALHGLFRGLAAEREGVALEPQVNKIFKSHPALKPLLMLSDPEAWQRYDDFSASLYIPALWGYVQADLYEDVKDQRKPVDVVHAALKHNSKVWSKYLRERKISDRPLSADFVNERYFGYPVDVTFKRQEVA
jgi:hypothetical protein